MTIEIRELVIQARVTAPDERGTPAVAASLSPAQEERWIETVSRRVLEQLREDGWGQR